VYPTTRNLTVHWTCSDHAASCSMFNSSLHDTAQLRTSAAKWLISERGFFAGTMPATTFISVSYCSVIQFNVACFT
jgi:hypothetical protein